MGFAIIMIIINDYNERYDDSTRNFTWIRSFVVSIQIVMNYLFFRQESSALSAVGCADAIMKIARRYLIANRLEVVLSATNR